MPGLYYFIPEAERASVDLFSQYGLAQSLGQTGWIQRHCTGGPDDKPGVFLVRQASCADRPGYFPDEQSWQKCANGLGIGWDRSRRPPPEELKRPNQVGGHKVRLLDGHQWLMPVLRSTLRGSMLPHGLVMDAAGKWSRRPLKVYAALHDQAESLWSRFQWEIEARNADEQQVEQPKRPQGAMLVEDLPGFAVRCLSVNYHVADWEVSAMGLLSDQLVYEICEAAMDIPAIVEVLEAMQDAKKKGSPASTPGVLPSSVGAEDSNLDTSPATPT